MNRLVWCLLVALLAIAMQVRSDDNVVHSTSGPPAEELQKDGQEEQQDAREQPTSLVKDDEHVNQTVAFLANIQQEMQQKRTQSEKAIADNRAIQEQTIQLLVEMQKEIQNHREELANDREQISKWQESITTNQVKTANVLMEVLQNISAIQVTQNQTIDVLNNLQHEFHAGSQQAVVGFKPQPKVNFLNYWSQSLPNTKSEMSKQRELLMGIQNTYESRIEQLERDNENLRSTLLGVQLSSYRSCKDVPMKVSGKYNIRGNDTFSSFVAYCEQQKFGGGWMVIQHRFDGSLSFNRNWSAYRSGFGDVSEEIWIGLERIHQFTREHDCELLVELKDFYNNYKYARYSLFSIGNESELYELKSLGGYSGTAGDALTGHIGMKFTTPDRDNDRSDSNCAKSYQGGWWFTKCHFAFLNGLYRNASGLSQEIIAWNDFSDDYRGMSFSRMLIRPLN
ncbi:fibrinogen-like protein 1 isoform X2 [Anopheles aquasalis]|uniref:fibrinogen-like protein 1 isoform X2 n=1 Tax=Anopheles aquasalis TaxID=42839 RepID=UPI00215A602B|nr:fibrinogen-like protein 1 isoform X2 [Anopheles aquasalis]